MTHYFIIIAYFIVFFTLLSHIPQVSRIFRVFRVVRGFTLSLLRVSIPHKPAVGSGGGCSLSSRTADSLNKNTLDYEIDPADGVEPPFELCRARDGVGCQLAVSSSDLSLPGALRSFLRAILFYMVQHSNFTDIFLFTPTL